MNACPSCGDGSGRTTEKCPSCTALGQEPPRSPCCDERLAGVNPAPGFLCLGCGRIYDLPVVQKLGFGEACARAVLGARSGDPACGSFDIVQAALEWGIIHP